jgi:hypothetical protein
MWWVLFLCFFIGQGSSLNAQVYAPPPCYYEVATTFFPYPLVAQALSMHHFTQDRWGLIYQDLQARSAFIPKVLQERAARMAPNPLQPYQPHLAAALLRAVLEETFVQSLQANYFQDPYVIGVMFRYIRVQQEARLVSCLGYGPMVDSPVTQ